MSAGLRRAGAVAVIAGVGFVFATFPALITKDPTATSIAVFALIFMVATTSWNIFSGYSGYLALGHAVRYHAWRGQQQGAVPELSGLRSADARALATGFLAGSPSGGWLPDLLAAGLLACYGIPLAPTRPAATEQEAAEADRQPGGVEMMIRVVQ